MTLGQQYNVGEKPTVILYTYINRHAGTPKQKLNINNCLKKNLNASRPSEHPPVMGGNVKTFRMFKEKSEHI